jgi:membrane-associated phospholipid phosphatase
MLQHIYDIGFYGPWILALIAIINLRNMPYYLVGYLVFSFLNKAINSLLKKVIKQPRPTKMPEYGMPSAHAQSVFFSTAFLYSTKGSIELLLMELALCALTLYQRWKVKAHTPEQLAVGALIGATLGYLASFTIRKILEDGPQFFYRHSI